MIRDNIASSSRLEATPTPPPSRSRRRALRRRIRGTTAAFVLALTAPYLAAATPLPQQHPSTPGHDPQPPSSSHSNGQSMVVGGLALLQGALRVVSPVFSSHAGGGSNQPERRWARLDTFNNMWHMPDGYVQLTQTMSPGFIVLSYLISLVGSWCTLELLIRRTSNRGLSNVLLLAAAGICFGAVSTFAMHFVGNQSLTLHHPAQLTDPDIPNIYLSYDGGFTVLSLVASCGAMTFAFFVMGTDIRVADWQSWCTPGDRKSRSDAASRRSRQDYNRWKVNKARLRKTANISTIFQQAGMMTSWSLMDAVGQRPSHHSWRDLVPWPRRKSVHEKVQDEYYAQAAGVASGSPDMDEDVLIQQDKELSEIDFRYGRNAARDELDRRAIMRNVEAPQSPGSLPSPTASHLQTQMVHQLPSSPLTAYYPANLSVSSTTPLFRTPSPQIDPSYSFPPRMHVDGDSTTNLLPRSDQLTAPPPIFLAPRRASVPTLQPAPPPRVAQTLSRIQSLPEPEGEGFTQPGDMYLDPENGKTGTVGSNSSKGCASSDSDTGDDYDHDDGMYHDLEDEDDVVEVHHGWRQRLRLKVQAGVPLTRLERAERFLGLDVVTWTEVFKIFVTGMVAGWGVAAMHYIGQISITKIPYIAYRVGYVVGSVIIASGAVIIALYIMFIMLRPKLKHSWVSKSIVAVILAGAVCGMHYTGMMGTIYGWEAAVSPTDTASMSGTKRAITGVVAALAFVACLAVVAFIVINSVRDRKERARRRRVVVASVLIDDENRMLVSAIDGMLPMCDIASLTPANHKRRGSSGDASGLGMYLTTGNEAFIQAMKMSWSWRNAFWSSLNPFASQSDVAAGTPIHPVTSAHSSSVPVPSPSPIPLPPTPTPSGRPPYSRRGSQATMEPRRGSQATTAAQSITSTMTVPTRVNIARFLEMFAISATQLSARLTGQHEGLSRLGVLYDRILTTGWVRLDSGTDTVSKGQLIFLVRRVTSVQERSDLLSRHFIFADPSAVAMSLHKTLSTPYDLVLPFLEDMRQFCDRTMRMTLRPNTLYAGVAVVQATPHDGLRILLNNQKSRSQLPMREVCTFSTLPGLPVDVAEGLAGTLEEIGEAVTWLDGMSLLSVITRNMTPETYNVGGPRVGRLLASLERAVVPLLDELLSQDDMAYILPRLTLHPVLVPLTPASPSSPRAGSNGTNGGWAAPHIIVFYANYDIAVNTFADKWLPFSLFRAQNECVMAGTVGKIARAAEASATSSSNGAASAPGSGGSRTPRQPSPSPAAAAPGSNPATSPTLSMSTASATSPDPAKYNPYTRRPSRVQFEMPQADPVPSFGNYSFPPKDGEITSASTPPPTTGPLFPLPSSRDRQPPRRSSLAKSSYRDDPEKEVLLVPGGAGGAAVAGIAQWDPNWLINLLRTRLRAET